MQSPIIIRKSPVGLFFIYLVGAVLVAGLLLGLTATIHQQGLTLTDTLPKLLLLGVLVVVLGTFVQAYVYMLSRVEVNATELRFVTWLSVFSSNVAVCDWRQIQNVDVKKAGIFSQAFDYGTLLVQTAGTERNLRITMIPQCEHWRDVIAQRADGAVMPVRNLS
jgi:hypothetical protein